MSSSIRLGWLRTAAIVGPLWLVACGPMGGGGSPGEDVETAVRALTYQWIGPISEEANKNNGNCRTLTGDGSAVATAAGCVGSYCDDMYLYCASASVGLVVNPTAPLSATSFVSEENGSPAAKCPVGTVISGLQARGGFADDISALCIPATLDEHVWAPSGLVCSWTPWLSEEQGLTGEPPLSSGRKWYFGGTSGGFATAVRCSGSYCDNMSYFGCTTVGWYNYYEFSTHDHRGYSDEGNWSSSDFKGECDSHRGEYMTGISANGAFISPELRPHRALCVGDNPRLDVYGPGIWSSRLRSHTVVGGTDRADTSTGDWDYGFYKTECGLTEVMVGISQTTSHQVSRILCAPMNQMRSNTSSCSVLTYSNVSDNRLNTLYSYLGNPTNDWDPGYSKNECGLKQVLKGVSSNPTTGEIHALLCCDQQPDGF
jgi:hypothetical protein